jgi:predicted ATP-grasp superfamily ATP-dependent carboligase
VTTVLVCDAEQRAALACTRSLGRRGYRVIVASARRRSIAGASRFCAAAVQVADPLTLPARFRQDVESVVQRHGVALVLPVTEQSVRALLPARLADRGTVVPFPSAAVFERASDKVALLEAARAVGMATPTQVVLPHPDALASMAPLAWPAQFAIKPARSVSLTNGTGLKLGTTYARSATELADRLARYPAAAYPLLLQQRIVGRGTGLFLLLWDGEILGVFAHERLREKPPSGGVSVYSQSIPADPRLVEQSVALLRRLEWQGVAMIEFKEDRASGTPYVLEMNGRFWGSLQLAIDAGVDFPALLVAAALGGRPAPVRSYRVGARCRWWWGDVDHLLTRLRRSAAALDLPPGAPSRGRVLRDFFSIRRHGERNEVLRLDDPRPFVRETIDWFRGR